MEPLYVGFLASLVVANLSNLPTHRDIFDPTHDQVQVVVLVLGVDEVGVVAHVDDLAQLEPLVSAVEVLRVHDKGERGRQSKPGWQVRKVVRNCVCSQQHRLVDAGVGRKKYFAN